MGWGSLTRPAPPFSGERVLLFLQRFSHASGGRAMTFRSFAWIFLPADFFRPAGLSLPDNPFHVMRVDLPA